MVSKAEALYGPREQLVDELGVHHPVVVALSRVIIALLRQEWLPSAKPRQPRKPACHFLLTEDFKSQVRNVFARKTGDGYTNKIPAIKWVREKVYESEGKNSYMGGLRNMKEYVEYVCEYGPEPEFIRNLPGYVPF